MARGTIGGGVARTSALLLIAGGLVPLLGALTPMPTKIWLGYGESTLNLVHKYRNRWRWANGAFLGGALAMGAGFVQYARRVRPIQPPWLATSALVAFLAGTGLWILELLFRLTTMTGAADTLARTGAMPSSYNAPARLAPRTFISFMVAANAALGAYGIALIRAGGGRLVWATTLISGGTLASLWMFGDSLPVFVHLAASLLGFDLLRRDRGQDSARATGGQKAIAEV